MGAAKVLGGLAFLIVGIILLIISFVPIPGLESVCLTTRIGAYVMHIMTSLTTLDLSGMIGPSGYLYIAAVIPWVGYHYCRAGIKSMRYDKEKKTYIITETKIGWMITGFIIICIAAVFLLLIILDILDPTFSFFETLWLSSPITSVPGLLPQALVPVLLTILMVFFVYFIGSRIMKSGVKKEVM